MFDLSGVVVLIDDPRIDGHVHGRHRPLCTLSDTRRRQMIGHDFRDVRGIARLAENDQRVRQSGLWLFPCDDDHGDVARQRIGGEVGNDRPAADGREIQIQQNQRWATLLDRSERGSAIADPQAVNPPQRQRCAVEPGQIGIVLDNQDLGV